MFAQAKQTANMELQSKFSSQFLIVSAEEKDSKYLVEGYDPTCAEMSIWICCNHGFCDEPNSNRLASVRNLQKRARHEAQLASDQAIRDTGGVVLNNRGDPMQPGQKK